MRIRTIKPEFFKDEELADLSALTRLIFIGLWCCADKNGIIEYRPRKLQAEILPYEGNNREAAEVSQACHELCQGGWLVYYEVNDKEYLAIRNWNKHQRINGKESQGEGLYPLPDSELAQRKQLGTNREPTGNQPGHTEQGTGSMEQGTGSNNDSSEPEEPASESAIVKIPLIKKDGEYGVTQPEIDEWENTYPAVDVFQTLLHIRQWNLDNPSKRKTRNGVRSHITKWLKREQDKGGNKQTQQSIGPDNPPSMKDAI